MSIDARSLSAALHDAAASLEALCTVAQLTAGNEVPDRSDLRRIYRHKVVPLLSRIEEMLDP